MAGLLADVRRLNGWGTYPVAEPFAGGAGASLSLLYNEGAPSVCINDADPAIYAFWNALLRRPEAFIARLEATPVTIAEWRRQRAVHARRPRAPLDDLGFATFYLNRCNRSGIILKGGPIGGHDQEGAWALDARYNVPALRDRCRTFAEHRERIRVSQEDGLKFIKNREGTKIFFFIDPPYYVKGPTLYLNSLDHDYHESLARQLKSMTNKAWVLTYDDCPEIRALYEGWATVRPFRLNYSAAQRRRGHELFVCPKGTCLPVSQNSDAISW